MNPDVDSAIGELERRGILPAEPARFLRRIARGELVSVRPDLLAALYVGVLLVAGGVGLLVEQNLEHIGPVTIAVAIGAAAAGCLGWVARAAPPFSRDEVAPPHLAFEYILLLGALLLGAELAYVEYRFGALGASWPWHLLLASLVYAALALRYDSRIVFSLSLSTFAAWRGVSVAVLERRFWSWGAHPAILANALACGLLFLATGRLLRRTEFKAHFGPVATHLGWVALLYALFDGAFMRTFSFSTAGEGPELWYAATLLVTSAGLVAYSWRRRRFLLLVLGVGGGFCAVLRFLFEIGSDDAVLFAVFLEAIGAIGFLLWAHRRLRERP